MFSRIHENDTEFVIKHYRVTGAAISGLLGLFFGYETFTTEGGGFMTLLLATLGFFVSVALAEIRTTRFDPVNRMMHVKKQKALGPVDTQVSFDELKSIDLERLGNDKLAMETLRVHTRKYGDIILGGYLVIRNEGGNLKGILVDWLASKEFEFPTKDAA